MVRIYKNTIFTIQRCVASLIRGFRDIQPTLRSVVETVRIISEMYIYFSADVKKPDSFESGLFVFGSWRCRSAHSGRKSHSKWDIIIVSGRPFVGLAFELFRFSTEFGYLLKPRQQKTRYIAATGFSYLEPGNVLLSHSKCYTIIGAVSFHY